MNTTDEWYEVEALSGHSWRLTEAVLFGSFLVAGAERAVLIDTGAGAGNLRATVDDLIDVPVTVVLSHSHWDHIGAAHQFDSVRINPVERTDDGRVTADVVTDDFGYGPADWVADWRDAERSFPDGFDPDDFEIEPVSGVESADPGEVLDLGGRVLELHQVPGHSPGQLAALDREAGVLYGGDVLHNEHALYVHFEGCDLEAYEETLGHLCELRDAGAFDTLRVSHAPPLSGDELALLDDLHQGVQAILAGEREGERVDDHPPAIRYEVGGKDVLVKPDAV